MEEVGPFAPIGLVIFVIVMVVVAVLAIVGLVVFVLSVATGVMVLNSRTERKRQAGEAEPDEAW